MKSRDKMPRMGQKKKYQWHGWVELSPSEWIETVQFWWSLKVKPVNKSLHVFNAEEIQTKQMSPCDFSIKSPRYLAWRPFVYFLGQACSSFTWLHSWQVPFPQNPTVHSLYVLFAVPAPCSPLLLWTLIVWEVQNQLKKLKLKSVFWTSLKRSLTLVKIWKCTSTILGLLPAQDGCFS